MKEILLTGATGYIGSHTAVELLNAGEKIVIVDDLSNSEASVIDRIAQITGVRPVFYQGDVADGAVPLKLMSVSARSMPAGIVTDLTPLQL